MILSEVETLDIMQDVLRRDVAPGVIDETASSALSLVIETLRSMSSRESVLSQNLSSAVASAAELVEQIVRLLRDRGSAGAEAFERLEREVSTSLDVNRWGTVIDGGTRHVLESSDESSGPDEEVSALLAACAFWEGEYMEKVPDRGPRRVLAGDGRLLEIEHGVESPVADAPEEYRSSVDLTGEKLEAMLKTVEGVSATAKVTDFKPVSGGMVNETYFFTLNQDGIEEHLVIRKDGAVPLLTFESWAVPHEFELLKCVFKAGGSVAEPLWCFPNPPGVDGAFMVMRRVEGAIAGSNGSLYGGDAEAILFDLAAELGRLHSMPSTVFADYVDAIGLDRRILDQDVTTVVRLQIEDWYRHWLTFTRKASPSEAYMIHFLRRHVPENPARPSMVHSDCSFHNVMRKDDRLTALLDWETAHLGDPAEDLAYVQDVVTDFMSWDRWMEHYVRHGGVEVSERQIAFYKVFIAFRNACTTNKAAARFLEGYVNVRQLPLGYEFSARFRRDGMRAIELYQQTDSMSRQNGVKQ